MCCKLPCNSEKDGICHSELPHPCYLVKERELMSYEYATERRKIFTEEGNKDYIKVRDEVKSLLKECGAFAFYGLKGVSDSWFNQGCLDYMVEQDELVCLRDANKAWMQFQV